MHLKYIHRVKEILTVFLEEEFGYILKKAQLHHYIPFSKRLKAKLSAKEKSWKPELHLRQALERLGPTFIKFGQLLSLRPDILPPEYIRELEKMQDDVPPVPYKGIKEVIKEEFGRPPERIFASFDKVPIASASLAQVYKARLKSGELVAVKVQRPGIKKVIKEDIEILRFIGHWMEKRKAFESFPLLSLVEEFERWTLREINFTFEAANTKIIRENFRGSKDVLIPRVFDEFCSERVLTTKLMDGIPIHDIEKIRKKKTGTKAIIQKAYGAMMKMVLSHGIFHADPHPGNVLVQGNKIVFLDFGIVGRFNSKLRSTTLKLLKASVENKPQDALNAVLDLQLDNFQKREELERDLRDILDQVHTERLKDIKISQLLSDVLETIHRYRIHVPMDFILFAKTMITMEGVGLRYSPDFRLLKETEITIRKEIIKRYSPSAFMQAAKNQAAVYKKLVEKTPEYVLQTLHNLSTGRFGVEIPPQELTDITIEMEHSSGNIAIGLMIAAITVSSAIMMQVLKEPFIFDVPFLSLLGFLMAGILGIWLIKRTIFTEKKR